MPNLCIKTHSGITHKQLYTAKETISTHPRKALQGLGFEGTLAKRSFPTKYLYMLRTPPRTAQLQRYKLELSQSITIPLFFPPWFTMYQKTAQMANGLLPSTFPTFVGKPRQIHWQTKYAIAYYRDQSFVLQIAHVFRL